MEFITIINIVAYITAPLFFVTTLAAYSKIIGYKIRKFKYKGKGIRIIYHAENKLIESDYLPIGSHKSGQIVEHDKKAFLYDPDCVRFLPKNIPMIGGEPFLVYTFKSLSPINLEKGKALKSPQVLYDVMESKFMHELTNPPKDLGEMAKPAIAIIIVLAIGYVLAKKFGYL